MNGHWDELLADTDRPPTFRALTLALAGRLDEARALIDELPLDVDQYFVPAWVLYLLGETEFPEKYWRTIDARPVHSNYTLTLFLYNLGGQRIWDLEWTPNYAARLAELGVELEPFVLPIPADEP